MSFATRLAEESKPLPISILEFDGDLSTDMAEDYESTTGWTGSGTVSGLAVETSNAKGLAGAITFDKTGSGSAAGFVQNSSLATLDVSDFAYESCWVYLSSLADVSQVAIRRGSSGANYRDYIYPVADLSAGWNLLLWDAEEVTPFYNSTTGSPTDASTDFLLLAVTLSAAGDTLSGIICTPPRQHPYRYSTSRVTSPLAPTKPWMQLPVISPNEHDPVTAVISSASASCVVVDNDGSTVLGDLAQFAFQDRGCKIKYGFAGDAESDDNYQAIFRGLVRSFPHVGKAWTFTLSDNLARFRRPFAQDASDASPYTITGNALDVLLKLATSTGNGTNGDYDTETEVRGAGISADLFDIDAIESVRDEWRGWADCSYDFRESQESLLAFFFEVCLSFALVPIVTGAGLLSVRAPEEALYPGISPSDLGASNIVAASLPNYSPNSERIRNQVRVLYNYDAGTEEYGADTGDDYSLADSIARYGLRELVIRARGITSSAVAAAVAKAHFYRIGNGSPPVDLTCFMSQQARQLGELVTLTSSLIPDLDGGSYSISGKLAEIETRGFSPHNPETRLTVGVTSYRRGNYRRIGPSGLADYDSQTDYQKATYVSIADGSGLLGSANDPAHEVGA